MLNCAFGRTRKNNTNYEKFYEKIKKLFFFILLSLNEQIKHHK